MKRYLYIPLFILSFILIASSIILLNWSEPTSQQHTSPSFEFDNVVHRTTEKKLPRKLLEILSNGEKNQKDEIQLLFISEASNCGNCLNEIHDYISLASDLSISHNIRKTLIYHHIDTTKAKRFARASGITNDFNDIFIINSSSLKNYNLELHLDEVLTIGEKNSEIAEYLFSGIRTINKVNDKILVVDASDNAIRIYSSNGEFIEKIGRRGRGPGEFQNISYLEVGVNDNLHILDRYQNRVTKYSINGELKRTIQIEDVPIGMSLMLFQKNNSEYLLAFRDFLNEEDQGSLIHHFNSDFTEKLGENLSVFDYFFDKSSPFEKQLSVPPSYLGTEFGEDNIAIVSRILTGTIGVLNKKTLEESQIGNKISNYVTQYDWSSRKKYLESDETGFATVSNQSGKYLYKRKGANFGLAGNNNYLLQFFGLFEGGKIIPYVNIYDKKGTLLSKIPLKNHKLPFISRENTFSFIPHYLDNNNRLYVADYRYNNSYPAVRVFETNLKDFKNKRTE